MAMSEAELKVIEDLTGQYLNLMVQKHLCNCTSNEVFNSENIFCNIEVLLWSFKIVIPF